MSREISNSDNVIDSRDVIKRIDELRTEIEDGRTAAMETWDDDESCRGDLTREAFGQEYLEINMESECAELKALEALAAEASRSPDWAYGQALIHDSYFEQYAQELAEDIGAIGRDLAWPACHIDWEAAADALKMDYFSVDYDGQEYWIRS